MSTNSQFYGVLAGCMPPNLEQIDAWLEAIVNKIATKKQETATTSYQPSVQKLADLIKTDGIVRMYVTEMIDQVPDEYKTIENIEQLLDTLDYIIQNAPEYNPNPEERNFFPMSSLFVRMMYTPAGADAFRNEAFNGAIRNILQAWCSFLDSQYSQCVLNTGETGWLSPSAYEYNKLDEFIIPNREAPHWGFESFNAYFHRQIKPECRPVDEPHNPKVIVSANDGTVYQIARNVKELDKFWLKSQPYSLVNMLDNSEYTKQFVGGDVFQSFLSGADYHRWRSPIDGIVKDAKVVNGLMFSELRSEGYDDTAGTHSQGCEASINTRGLVFIESEDPTIGMVCVIPIGITEISSVTIEVIVGQRVKKGDELGYFSYGGSSMCLVFQPGAINHFTVESPSEGNNDNGEQIKVNARIAIAN